MQTISLERSVEMIADRGIGKLIATKRVRKAIVSHIGLNPETQRQMMAGEMEVELVVPDRVFEMTL
jgi:acetate CoA/acetoacetate CoA-transferase alpha subunit